MWSDHLSLVYVIEFPPAPGGDEAKVIPAGLKLVRANPKLPGDGRGIPKSQGRGWRFDSRL